MMQYDRAQLKLSVKAAMRSTRPNPMLMTLLFSVMVSVGTGIVNFVNNLFTGGIGSYSERLAAYVMVGYDMEEAVEQALLDFMSRGPGALMSLMVVGVVVTIVLCLWQGVMGVGYEGYALSMVRGENPDAGKLFCAFPRIGGVLITCVLEGIFIFLWSLPVALVYAVVLVAAIVIAALSESMVLTMLLVLAALAVLVAGMMWVSVRYALVDYVLLDQGLSGMDALRENKRLMQGNIGRAFTLQLSFIGWNLLTFGLCMAGIMALVVPITVQAAYGHVNDIGGMIASAGIGLFVMLIAFIGSAVIGLWLRPYETGAMAKFYEWARGANAPTDPANWNGPTDYTWSTRSTIPGPGPGPTGPIGPKDDPWN